MKIASSQLDFAARHLATQEKQVRESLEITNAGNRPPPASGKDTGQSSPAQISNAGRQSLQAEAAQNPARLNRQMNNGPMLNMLRMAVEMMTGKKINICDAEVPDPNEASGIGMSYERHTSYTETESTEFSAQGTVRTADGREISFQLNLSMFRAYHEEEHIEFQMGSALKDPLVLNFEGNAAELSDMRFSFDLDADGKSEELRALKPGSGFLVFDRNGDGKVNNGRELFGAMSGDGFGELAALDDDGNGWIDENDRAFGSLYVWTKDANGQDVLRSLKAGNIGAIALANAYTPFSIKDANNQLLGQIQSTGVFLKEDGSVGTVQKVDLAV